MTEPKCVCGSGKVIEYTIWSAELETWVPRCIDCFVVYKAERTADFVAQCLRETFNSRTDVKAYVAYLRRINTTVLIAATSWKEAEKYVCNELDERYVDVKVRRAYQWDADVAGALCTPVIVKEIAHA